MVESEVRGRRVERGSPGHGRLNGAIVALGAGPGVRPEGLIHPGGAPVAALAAGKQPGVLGMDERIGPRLSRDRPGIERALHRQDSEEPDHGEEADHGGAPDRRGIAGGRRSASDPVTTRRRVLTRS